MTSPNQDPTRPSWVILGFDAGDQVAIYASRELDDAIVDHKVTYADVRSDLMVRVSALRDHIELTVDMRSYVIVMADTYAQAFARLFALWSPDQPAGAAAIESRPAIGPAPHQGE